MASGTATDHLANEGIFLDSDSDGGLDIVEQREVSKILTTRQLGFFQATPLWGRLFESRFSLGSGRYLWGGGQTKFYPYK
jgi:hypothetical protein